MDLLKFNELVNKRDNIEKEIEEHLQFLESSENKGVGMHEKLVDEEGFPRSDIDILSIRTARHKVICLKNDYLDVNKEIEKCLLEIHQKNPRIRVERNERISKHNNKSNGIINTNDTNLKTNQRNEEEELAYGEKNKFAIISQVIENSPCAFSGLQVGDCVYEFGGITKDADDIIENNDELLNKIYHYTQTQPSEIIVKVVRGNEIVCANILPQHNEKGFFIGCHLQPL